MVYFVACHLSEGSHFGGMRTCGGLECKWSSHNPSEASNLSDLVKIGYIARRPFIMNTICSRYTIKSLLRVDRDNILQYHALILSINHLSCNISGWSYCCPSDWSSAWIQECRQGRQRINYSIIYALKCYKH